MIRAAHSAKNGWEQPSSTNSTPPAFASRLRRHSRAFTTAARRRSCKEPTPNSSSASPAPVARIAPDSADSCGSTAIGTSSSDRTSRRPIRCPSRGPRRRYGRPAAVKCTVLGNAHGLHRARPSWASRSVRCDESAAVHALRARQRRINNKPANCRSSALCRYNTARLRRYSSHSANSKRSNSRKRQSTTRCASNSCSRTPYSSWDQDIGFPRSERHPPPST